MLKTSSRPARLLRNGTLAVATGGGLIAAAIFAGPLSSGGLFLLRAAPAGTAPQIIPEDYRPRHEGGIDLAPAADDLAGSPAAFQLAHTGWQRRMLPAVRDLSAPRSPASRTGR